MSRQVGMIQLHTSLLMSHKGVWGEEGVWAGCRRERGHGLTPRASGAQSLVACQ